MGDPKHKFNPFAGVDVRNSILYASDCFLSLFVIPVASVIAWVSIFYVVELLTDEYYRVILISVCIVLHSASHLCCKFIYRFIREHVTAPTTFYIVSKVYIYFFAFASIVIYGVVPEHYSTFIPYSESPYTNSAFALLSFFILLSIRCRPHIVSFGNDCGESTPEEVFLFPYRFFKFSWKKNKLLYVLDSLFSVSFIGILVILVWKGAWGVLDQAVYPDDYELSGWTSLTIGYSILFIGFPLQAFIKIVIREYGHWPKLVILDLYVVFSFCGTINLWRGIWILVEQHTNLDTSLLDCIVLHFVSFFILVIFNSSNTLLVRGVYIDAEEEGEHCVDFPCNYFRLMFQGKEKALDDRHVQNTKREMTVSALEDGSVKHYMVTQYIDQGSDEENSGKEMRSIVIHLT